ncbi:peptide-methionine (S)-S-oxide reductase MsrA [Namhaeicola litoreus]|uniref:Peptide methionine sulfoxide reductase MsrA n=1 Tax=Namhaeicola litoreus TaxID=1052145 RepID=A0ABW3Y1W4_9FLAO
MKKIIFLLLCYVISVNLTAQKTNKNIMNNKEVAIFGNGCFWCTEAIFMQLKGVESVLPGYSGGKIKNPSYKEVCTGNTGHAEVIQITFDPKIISFRELLEVFFYTHDPTTLNRQGNDVGTQYRSAIFYKSQNQKAEAEKIIKQLESEDVYDNKIVTEITAFDVFYPAEDYHQNYYNNNKDQPYCRAVINPKLDKFVKKYQSKLK